MLSSRPPAQPIAEPDLGLWDRERIDAWRRALNAPAPPPLAVLRIPKIRLEVAILPGTDDFDAQPCRRSHRGHGVAGGDGNSGIAGHRDGFFRGLKDIGPDDAIELETLRGKEIYRVERIWVVDPEDVSVLDPTPARSLTLVTCYPVLPRRSSAATLHRPRGASETQRRDQNQSNVKLTRQEAL